MIKKYFKFQKAKIIIIVLTLAVITSGIILFYLKTNENPIEDKLIGKWENFWEFPHRKILLLADFEKDSNNKINLKISIPTLRIFSIPVNDLLINKNKISFKVNKFKAAYTGVIKIDSNKIVGTWQQEGRRKKLILYREDKFIRLNRPQYPIKPYPYKSLSVKVPNKFDNIILAGTYTYPKGKGPFPSILLISGIGPQDRDETMYGHKPFLVLADYFTRLGFGVLRLDDRGTGESTGNFNNSTTLDFAHDAVSSIKFLKKLKGVDTTKIGIIGFNEGGIIASMVASKLNDIAFIVLLATPGLPGKDILLNQTTILQQKAGVAKKEIQQDIRINKKIFEIIENVKDSSTAVKKLEKVFKKFRRSLSKRDIHKRKYSFRVFQKKLKYMLGPWFKFYLKYNPLKSIKDVKCPVLILYGENDLQVSPKGNMEAIENALKKEGNYNVKAIIIPKLNHLFQVSKTGLPKEYSKIKQTFSPDAMKIISNWINNIPKR